MSQVIDESIVRMKFDGEQFMNGVKGALSSLSNLGSGIKNGIASIANLKNELNFRNINSNFSLDGIEKSLEALSERFSTVGVIGMTTLQNITNATIDAGKKISEALIITPVKSGFQEYETQINAVQTILANTESKGTTLDDVNKALDELNKYADMTIYNFTQMTKNIGTFTAAGIDLDTSVQAIKGIANLAAVSGSNAQQASTAMYQLSQALAAGSLKLQDWNSVVNAGMGGQVFQDALKETAKVHGIAVDDMIKKAGSFRESLKDGWITSEILTETLAKFTGDLTAEDLKKKGYSDEQIKSILKMGQTANDAATKVKTFTQLMDTLNESLQSGWTQSWEILIGDFEEAKSFLTEISDALSEMINKSSDTRNALLQSWKDLGGRDSLIEAVKNSMEAITTVTGNVKKAFTDIFPPITAEGLFKITSKIKKLSEVLKKISDVKLTFLTEFLSTIKSSLPFIGNTVKKLLQSVSGVQNLSGGVNNLIKRAGTMVKSLLPQISSAVTSILDKIKSFLPQISSIISSVFGRVNSVLPKITSAFTSVIDRIKQAIPGAIEILKNALTGVVDFVKRFYELGGIESILQILGNAFKFVGIAALAAVQAFSSVFSSVDISADSVYDLVEKIRELTVSFLSSENAADNFKRMFTSIFGFIRTVIGTIGTAAKIILNLARSVIPVLISAFTSGINILGSFIKLAVNLAGAVLPVLVSIFGTAVTAVSSFAWQGISLAGQILPAIIGAVGKAVRVISDFIRRFIALGGLTSAAGALRNAFESLRKILGIISSSFSQVFKTSGSGVSILVGIIEKIRQLTAAFLNSDTAAAVLKKTFASVFGAVSSGIRVIKSIAGTVSQMAVSVLPVLKQILNTLIPKSLSMNVDGIAAGFSGLLDTFKNLTSYKSNFFTGIITILSKCAAGVSSFVQQFVKMDGITSIISALRGSFESVLKMAGIIGQAFNNIFPSSGINANPIYDLVENIRKMTTEFLTSETAADRLQRIFSGVFAAFDIGKTIVTALAAALGKLISGVAPVGGGIMETAASVGDFIVMLDEGIRSSDIFGKVFDKIAGFLSGFASTAAAVIGNIKGIFAEFKNSYGDVFGGFVSKISDAVTAISPIFSKIGELFKVLLECFRNFAANAASNLNLDNVLDIFGAGTLAGMAVGIKSFIDSITDVLGDKGLLGGLTGILDGAQGCLESWQTSINVGIIKQIAVAIAILAVSLIGLSLIDNESLVSSMTAVTLMLTEVIGAMAIFSKMAGGQNASEMKSLPLQMIGISVAMLILSSAVEKLASLDWDGVAKGVVGIGALLTELGAFLKIMGMSQDTGNPAGFMGDQMDDVEETSKSGLANMVGLLALAEALNILATAVTKIAALDWEGLGKGVLGIGLLLTELGLFVNNTGGANKVISTSIGMIALGTAMLIFAKAVERLGSMSLEQIGKGLLAMAGVLTEVVAAVNLLPPNTLSAGAGLAVISASILILSSALQGLGNMSLESIGKGLLAMTVSLAAIVIALNAASGGLAGAAAILAAAAAISVLTPALIILGNLSLEQIGKSLLMIAGVFGVMAVAGLLLTPLTPVILALGAAMLIMDAAVALLGAGTLALSAGLSALVVSADTLLITVVKALDDLIKLVCDILIESAPAIVQAVVVILDEIIKALGPLSVTLIDTADIIIVKLIELIDKDAPLLIDCVANIIMKILDRIADDMYMIIDCGMRIISGLIQGISDNIQNVVEAAIDLVVNFINGIAEKIDDVIAAGVNLVVKLVDGIAEGIEDCNDQLIPAVDRLAKAIIDGLVKGIGSGVTLVVDSLKEVGTKAIDGIKDLLGIHSPSTVGAEIGGNLDKGVAIGIDGSASSVEDSAKSLGDRAVSSMQGALGEVSDIFSEETVFSPTIRPVVDMDNVQSGAKAASDLFSGTYSAKGSMTLTSNAAQSIAQETAKDVNNFMSQRNGSYATGTDISELESSSKSISDKMESMLTRFDKFTEALSNMQMVMDSGALVGQISSGLDRNLGTVASMKKRGV